MKISVAMATYNGTRFLQQQLDSLLDQTRLPDEVVCLDDASSDDTVAILKAFADAAPFSVQVHVSPENRGAQQTFSSVISLADGDVICFCDQDDVWSPTKIKMIEERFQGDSLLGLVLNDAYLVDENLARLGSTLWQKWDFTETDARAVQSGSAFHVFARRMPPYGSTMSLRADLRGAILPVPSPNTFDAWIGQLAAVLAPVGLIDQPLQQYRQHPAQVTGFTRRTFRSVVADVHRQGSTESLSADTDRQRHLLEWLERERDGGPRDQASTATRARLELNSQRQILRCKPPFRRLGILRLLLNGSYRRHASGARSALVDLLAGDHERVGRSASQTANRPEGN